MSEYPLRTDHLQKGSRISAEEIEHAFSVKIGTDDYRLALLRARKYIEWKLAERGQEIVVRTRRNDLVILTDEEAMPFTDREFSNTMRKLARTLRKQQDIDRAKVVNVELVRKHDRKLVVNGATYLGAARARRSAAQLAQLAQPKPRKRLTPG